MLETLPSSTKLSVSNTQDMFKNEFCNINGIQYHRGITLCGDHDNNKRGHKQ